MSLDGVALKGGERIVLTRQTNAWDEGIWFVRSLRRNEESTEADATSTADLHLPFDATPPAREEP